MAKTMFNNAKDKVMTVNTVKASFYIFLAW